MAGAPLDDGMPDDDFDTSSIFLTEDGGGRVFTSASRPRLAFEDTWTQGGSVSRVWMTDGDRVASLEEAEARLATAPVLTADEAAMIARIDDDWTDHAVLVGPMDGVVLEWDTPAGRNTLALKGLKAKGLTEDGREGTRLWREGRPPPPPPPPPVPTAEEKRRAAIVAKVVDVGADLRLVPVFAWQANSVEPPGYPHRDRFIDIGAVADEGMFKTLVTDLVTDLGSGTKTYWRLPGGFLLMEDDRILIRPGDLGELSDLHSWRAAAEGAINESYTQACDPDTGWIRLWVGDWMTMLPQDTTVWLCQDMGRGPRIEPDLRYPIWNIRRRALAAAVADAAAGLDVVAERLRRSLAGVVPDDDVAPLAEWLLHATGPYHDLQEET